MGGGIAQVTAQNAKLNVILYDISEKQLANSVSFMDKLLKKNIEKGKLTDEERQATLGRIQTTTQFNELSRADFVIEAVSENLELKKSLFQQLNAIARPEVVLATNTSSISITKIAAVTTRPENVIGMHFMNPVPVMKLVEVITGLATSESTLLTTLALTQAMGKVTTKSDDVPGFIANRLLMPYINEAVFALQEGLGTKEDIGTCQWDL